MDDGESNESQHNSNNNEGEGNDAENNIDPNINPVSNDFKQILPAILQLAENSSINYEQIANIFITLGFVKILSSHGLDKAEFHSPVMQAGSTGTYSDMTGGHTFTQYDCGHEYNDEIVPQSQTGGKAILDDIKFDKNEMRKAFVMQEILKRKVI